MLAGFYSYMIRNRSVCSRFYSYAIETYLFDHWLSFFCVRNLSIFYIVLVFYDGKLSVWSLVFIFCGWNIYVCSLVFTVMYLIYLMSGSLETYLFAHYFYSSVFDLFHWWIIINLSACSLVFTFSWYKPIFLFTGFYSLMIEPYLLAH